MKKQKVLYIDQLNLFIRNFATLPTFNDNGEHVGALFGTLNSYVSLLKKHQPDIVLCAWEGKGSSDRRKKITSEYKEGRVFRGFNKVFEGNLEKEQMAFKDQLKKMREYNTMLPFHQFSVDFLEADDVIAYISQKIFNDPEYFDNIIITSDRDYFQIINENTNVFRPIRTKENKTGKLYGIEDVVEETGCHPENYIILKCITGDASDNVTGIKGVGQKTVLKYFPFLNSPKAPNDIYKINDIIKFSEEQVEKKILTYQKIVDNKELLLRNYELMQLLNPNISLASIKAIEQTFTNRIPKFKITPFRFLLLRDNISPKNASIWTDVISNVHPKKITLG